VLDAAVRSWAPVDPFCLRWAFPVWSPAPDLDPGALEQPSRKRSSAPRVTLDDIIQVFDGEPMTRSELVELVRESTGAGEKRIRKTVKDEIVAGHLATISRPRTGKRPEVLIAPKDMEIER
jgi:hypothetical protein